MRFTLSIIFTILSILFAIYICVIGVMDHWSVTYWHIIILCLLLSAASWFITQGAYDSLEDDN